jgi:hypothetical protein
MMRARNAALDAVDRVLTASALAGILAVASAGNELSGGDIAKIVGEGSSSRSGTLCRLAPQARDGLSATEVAAALGPQIWDQGWLIAEFSQQTKEAFYDLPCVNSLSAMNQAELRDLYRIERFIGSEDLP